MNIWYVPLFSILTILACFLLVATVRSIYLRVASKFGNDVAVTCLVTTGIFIFFSMFWAMVIQGIAA